MKMLLSKGEGENRWEEKADQIRVYSGLKFQTVDTAQAGTVCAVTGLSHTRTGDGLGAEQGAAALMEMEGKDAEAVAWRSVGDGSELAEALKGIPARIDGAALAWKVCLKVEIQSGTVRVTELEDGSIAYVWEALLEPCKRKGKPLRMTRVDGKQGVYAVYAEDDLAGVVSGISQEEREEMLRTLREIC